LSVDARAPERGGSIAGRSFTPITFALLQRYTVLKDNLDRIGRLDLTRSALACLLALNACICVFWALQLQSDGLQDLGSFLHSAEAYQEGLDPYRFYAWLKPPPISPEALNLNPPISVYLFQPFVAMDTTAARIAFLLGSLALFGVSIAWLLLEHADKRRPLVLLTVLSLAGVWHTLGYLQIYAPILLVIVAAWYFMRHDRLLLAGIAIGLVIAIKPNFALWPLLLLLGGHRQTPFVALVTAATVSAIPLVAEGPAIYRQWLNLTTSFSGVEWTSNASLIAIGSRLGAPGLGALLAASMLLWLAWFLWRERPDLPRASSLAIAVVLLASPASWAGYTLFLLPALFSRAWDRKTWACVLLLATPFWLVGYGPAAGAVLNVLLGSTYAWAMLLLLALVARDVTAEEPERQSLAVAA
jgi:hypothetical protein